MKSVYTILRRMIKRGYLMRDTSVDIFSIDTSYHKPYNVKNKGSEMTENKTGRTEAVR